LSFSEERKNLIRKLAWAAVALLLLGIAFAVYKIITAG
jgi:hypothetical protein